MNIHVSILVIMELALEARKKNTRLKHSSVSILVIMELALEGLFVDLRCFRILGFNPCYYGIGFRRVDQFLISQDIYRRFNPCYYGIGFRREEIAGYISAYLVVSILVIMELALEAERDHIARFKECSFNPCYYGIGFRRHTRHI